MGDCVTRTKARGILGLSTVVPGAFEYATKDEIIEWGGHLNH